MEEISIGDKIYISSKRAAQITGYAKDYIGQLCREGRVEARLVGRNWYVLESSIREHRFGAPETVPEAEKAEPLEATPEDNFSRTWQKPQYEALKPVTMPEVRVSDQKAEQQNKAVSDMQSAWREWFESKSQEVIPTESEANTSSPTEVDLQDEVEEVSISRIPEPVSQKEAETGENVVPIIRNHSIRETREHIPQSTNAPSLDLSQASEKKQLKRKSNRGTESAIVSRAIFVAVSLMVSAIAVIGTGYVDKFPITSFFGIDIQTQITDFLSGTSHINN